MTDTSNTTAVRQTVERLIEHGSHFNIEELDRIYHEQLTIVIIDETGAVTAMDKAENMALFRNKRESGAEPLSTAADFNYVAGNADEGHVIVTRKMRLQERVEKSIISIHLVRKDGQWQVIHETAFVQPIDEKGDAGEQLYARTRLTQQLYLRLVVTPSMNGSTML